MTVRQQTILSIKQFEIWIADLEPQRGTETGKVRLVLGELPRDLQLKVKENIRIVLDLD